MMMNEEGAGRRFAALNLDDADCDAAELCARYGLENVDGLAPILMWASTALYGYTCSFDEPEAMYRPWVDDVAAGMTRFQEAARALIELDGRTMPGIARFGLLDRFGPSIGPEVCDALHDIAFFERQNPIDPHAPGGVRIVVQAFADFLQQQLHALSSETLVAFSCDAMRARWTAKPSEIATAARSIIRA